MNPARILELAREWAPELLVAAGQTLRMTLFAYVLGAVAGLLIALGGLSRRRGLPGFCRIYIEFIRGTPTLTQLFLIYFGLASVNIIIPGFEAAVVALGLHYAVHADAGLSHHRRHVFHHGLSAVPRRPAPRAHGWQGAQDRSGAELGRGVSDVTSGQERRSGSARGIALGA